MSTKVRSVAKVGKEAAEATELMFELLQAHKRQFHAFAKEQGLSPQQAATLMHLVPGEGLPMSAIAELLMCDASNVTGIVDKLEARGLAKRDQGEDRRVKVLTLTGEGDRMRSALREHMLTPPGWIANLTRDDQRALRDILRRAAVLTAP